MSNVLVNDTSLTAIANAIRSKLGVSTTYKPGQMASAIQSIPTGGGSELDYTIRQVNVTGNAPTVTRDFTNFIFIAQVDEDSLPTTPANTTAYYLEFAYVNGNFIRKANNKAFVVHGNDSTYKGAGSNAANLSVGTTSITFTAYTSQLMYNSTWNVIQIELPNDADIYSFATH